MVACCELDTDAKRIKEAIGKRLKRFHLDLNEEKTKLVSFSKIKFRQGIRQETFDFLGFTFYWGKSQRGIVIPKLKTRGKTLSSKLKKVNDWARRNRNRYKLVKLWKIFCMKLAGHQNYYGVSHNTKYVEIFLDRAVRIMFKWINRRSQKRSFAWDKFKLFLEKWPPPKAYVKVKLF